jgi:hypothetical protein
VNIQTIPQARGRLLTALASNAKVVGDIDQLGEVDLTLVQLLDSARRTALDAGGMFVLAAPAQGELLDLLRRGGFIETAQQRAFWLLSEEVQP